MRLDEAIDKIEGCCTLEELKLSFHDIAQDYGFASFGFIDVGSPGLDSPFWMATSSNGWHDDYRSNGLMHVDPVLPMVRRTNTPFTWADVPMPERLGKRKPGALKAMDAARDHGFQEGLVIPFHFVDNVGRLNSASCVLHWKDKKAKFFKLPRSHRSDLHILLIYWAQKVMELATREIGRRNRFSPETEELPVNLTDRERNCLQWAARGKTMAETAVILSISGETVETYFRNALRKLGSVNKTQAVVKAVMLGLINV